MKRIHYISFLIALSLGLITLVPALASAQTSASVGATVTTPVASVTLTAAEKTAITRADKEITRRISALTDLNTRIQAMQEVTAAFKSGISASITNEINTLTNLQTTIDAETDVATLKTDIHSITTSYRVFAL